MNYRETLLWLYAQLPMYQRIGGAAYKANLDNTIALCNLLGNPQNHFDSIHVAGTNGKGSVSHMLASILQEYGLKTGLYTSPHLKDFRERIRINGQMIPKRKVTGFVNRYKKVFEQMLPSFFEMTVGLAFDYFREEEVDIAVVEVGMGGRLDSTNIITPLVSVITNISFDHTQYLGDTLEKIAAEKAGIIKPGVPVVIGETRPETEPLFREQAKAIGSSIVFADREYSVKRQGSRVKGQGSRVNDKLSLVNRHGSEEKARGSMIDLPLKGVYQQKNLQTVLAVIQVLQHPSSTILHPASGIRHPASGIRHPASGIRFPAIRAGIAHVVENTGIRGRWEILQRHPLIICDTGHNEAGIREVVAQLGQTPHKRLHMVFGQVNDKDTGHILKLLPQDACYYFCRPDIPRGLDAEDLRTQASLFDLHGKSYPSVRRALAAAKKAAGPEDLIFVGGSTFVVAEVVP